MKIKLILSFVLIYWISISCQTSVNNNLADSENNNLADSLNNSSANVIKQRLREEGINSYYANDSLIIVNKNNQEIKRIKIYASDTLYNIVQSQNNDFLFIGLASFGDCFFQFMGLVDLKTKDWVVFEELNTKSDDWEDCVLPNPAYMGTSSNKKYHLFEGGTGITRDFQVYKSGKLIKKGTYISGDDEKQLHWDKNDRFYYFTIADILPDSLPAPKEYNGYIQKIIWSNEKDSLTNEFKEVYFQ